MERNTGVGRVGVGFGSGRLKVVHDRLLRRDVALAGVGRHQDPDGLAVSGYAHHLGVGHSWHGGHLFGHIVDVGKVGQGEMARCAAGLTPFDGANDDHLALRADVAYERSGQVGGLLAGSAGRQELGVVVVDLAAHRGQSDADDDGDGQIHAAMTNQRKRTEKRPSAAKKRSGRVKSNYLLVGGPGRALTRGFLGQPNRLIPEAGG